jgi:hypothetical protein
MIDDRLPYFYGGLGLVPIPSKKLNEGGDSHGCHGRCHLWPRSLGGKYQLATVVDVVVIAPLEGGRCVVAYCFFGLAHICVSN